MVVKNLAKIAFNLNSEFFLDSSTYTETKFLRNSANFVHLTQIFAIVQQKQLCKCSKAQICILLRILSLDRIGKNPNKLCSVLMYVCICMPSCVTPTCPTGRLELFFGLRPP